MFIFKKIAKIIIAASLLGASTTAFSQTVSTTEKYANSILIINGTAHLGNGEIIKNAAIGMVDGKINYVGRKSRVAQEKYSKIVSARGKDIYPGFISMSATNEMAANSGVLSKQEVVKENSAFNSTQMVNTENGNIKSNLNALHLDLSINDQESFNQLRSFLINAKDYSNIHLPIEENKEFENIKGIFNGEKVLFVHANNAMEMLAMISLKNEFEIKNMVFVGGEDAPLIADELIKNDIGVVITEDVIISELGSSLPKQLYDLGVLFSISTNGNNFASLPDYAGRAVANGLPREAAVKGITSNAALMMGANHIGSLEIGKDATLFIANGDPLDVISGHIETTFVAGIQYQSALSGEQISQKLKP